MLAVTDGIIYITSLGWKYEEDEDDQQPHRVDSGQEN